MGQRNLHEILTRYNIRTSLIEDLENFPSSKSIGIEYEHFWLTYQREYHQTFDNPPISFPDQNLSDTTIYWPLSISRIESKKLISSDGQNIFLPVFSDQISEKAKSRLLREIFLELLSMSRIDTDSTIGNILVRENEIESIHPWVEMALDSQIPVEIVQNCNLQLEQTVEQIETCFGSSTRKNIRTGIQDFDIQIFTGLEAESVWTEFKNLHLRVAGKATRSDRTWELQLNSILSGNGCLVMAKPKSENEFISGILVQYNQYEAYYSVAATIREYFDVGINHAMQWRIIEHLKSLSIIRYQIGQKVYPSLFGNPSLKEINIGRFKRQFVSRTEPSYKIHFNSD